MSKDRILVIDDEPDIRDLLKIVLGRMGHDVFTAKCVSDANKLLSSKTFQLVLTDMKMPDGDGFDVLNHTLELKPQPPCAILTAHGSVDMALEALRRGAFDFASKPVSVEKLRKMVDAALIQAQAPAIETPPSKLTLIGDSAPMQELRSKITKLSKSLAPIYISGEAGSGKELTARALHAESGRAAQPFIRVNCSAMPHDLIESEFFGHIEGAFPGAHSDKLGLFAAANGGTLFLEEVSELPQDMQVKLLNAIQHRSIRPVGATTDTAIDVRILCSTHKNLTEEVEAGRFRQDLYYRINVIELRVPPLRERPADLPQLSSYLLERFSSRMGVEPPTIGDDAANALTRYPFPGNIRELENTLERAFTLCENQVIEVRDLGLPDPKLSSTLDTTNISDLDDFLANIERSAIVHALDACNGNRTAAAKRLGISFRSIRYRIDRLEINADQEN